MENKRVNAQKNSHLEGRNVEYIYVVSLVV